jgi:hypothetical protein
MSRFEFDKEKRSQAEKSILPFVKTTKGFKGIDDEDSKKLLTSQAYAAMKKDPIRKLGPTVDSTYPWNIVDYMFYIESDETY